MNLKQQKGLNILSGSNPNDDRRTPFIIGFYHGRDKPRNVHSFLQPMLNEFDRLCPDIDDVIPLRSCTASLRCVIADSPMRSYLKGTKGHSGYWACDRCIQRGEMVKKIIIMTDVDAPLRTDDDFLSYHTNEFSIDEHVKDVENPSYAHYDICGIFKKTWWFHIESS
jgi:hypothetical protein